MIELFDFLCPFIGGFLIAILLQMERERIANDNSRQDKEDEN